MWKIKTLNTETMQDFFKLHDEVDFSYAPGWKGCYCQFYYQKDQKAWQEMTVREKKEQAVKRIEAGRMGGFLAYDQEEPIGWLSADDSTRYVWSDEPEFQFAEPTVILMCLLIRPDYRRQGVAKALIQATIEHYKRIGYQKIVVQAFYNEKQPEKSYHGTPRMYEDLGFTLRKADPIYPVYERIL